jgi:23S rRNA pseudouridine2605 synthase
MISTFKNKPEGDLSGDTAAETKPKAKARKKAATTVEASTPETPVAAEAATTKPKAARKTAAKKAAPVEEPVEEPVAEPAAKKAVKKKAKPEVDEPEVASEAPEVVPDEEASAPAIEQPETTLKPEPKLERLQKILAKAGISSRRKAEELILGGQVQINGKVVTELGTKADPERDHVRVDGKLLQGPERIRYFVLNKPKGFVTTVSDPEGRPTVMQFFASERERLYPVGRLDYLSEGLLLVTNDGELANKLTKAASGVEKTYLVKVAGQPTEDMLDVLRSGVVIERGRPGENTGRVRTAPAKIRQVRQGDNPWYEVIIIEGRNRELRKMFEEIGHHVEKIRRVGYGPLILDLEPGKLRELEADEVQLLRLAADGKLKKKNKKSAAAGQLPTVAGKTVRYKRPDGKPSFEPRPRVRPEFQTESKAEFKPAIRALPKAAFKPAGKPEFRTEGRAEGRPAFKAGFKKEFKPAGRPESRPDSRPDSSPASRPPSRSEFTRTEGKPAFKSGFKSAPKRDFKPDYPPRPRPAFGGKPRGNRPSEPPVTEFILPPRKGGPIEPDTDFDTRSPHQGAGFNPDYKPGFRKGDGPRPDARSGARSGSGAKPAFRSDRPGGKPAFRADKPASPRGEGTRPLGRYNAADDDYVPKKTPGFRVEPVEEKPREERPRSGGFMRSAARPGGSAARSDSRPARPFRPRTDTPGRPTSSARPAAGERPFRPASARPDARPDGAPPRRPKSFDGAGDGPREFRPREAGARDAGPRGTKPFGAPKKFAGKSFGAKKFDAPRPAPGGSNSVPKVRLGPDGQPRVKVRHRNSFTGKNKGRPKPKSE